MKSSHPMHVHLYKVSRSPALPLLETLIAQVNDLPIEQRLRRVGSQQMRLELAMPPDQHNSVWRLGFCKFRNDGPGRASVRTKIESIPLENGQSFSEDTAAIYDPATQCLVLQYNHYGPRAASISDYLSSCAGLSNEAYSILLQLNPSAQARLTKKTIFTRVLIKVAPAKLSSDWKANNVSMASALQKANDIADGDWLTVEIGLDDQSRSASLGIGDKIKSLLGLADEPREAIGRLIISGRDDPDSAIDPVNLLDERLERSFPGLQLDKGRRVPMDTRWRSLSDAYIQWKKSGLT